MLRLTPEHPVETLWDTLLPAEVRVLPESWARWDEWLCDPGLLRPFQDHWRGRVEPTGRPTIPMATYLRLMVVKQRTGWGYEALVREVSDSLHLRRFCLLSLLDRVPDESTVRKLTRRLGAEVVDELVRELVGKACRERRFCARAMRCDSTVVEADVRYPTDAGLCADAVKALARAGRRVRQALPAIAEKVRDRSQAVDRCLRELGRSLSRRTGAAKEAVQRLTERAAAQVGASLAEARRLVAKARLASSITGRRAIADLEERIGQAARIVDQIGMRFRGEKIVDRLVSLADPDARPVRRGKRARPTEFGYVVQWAELTPNTRRGARGLLLPPKLQAGSTHDNTLLPETVEELRRLDLSPREVALDGGFTREATRQAFEPLRPSVFIAGSPHPGSRRTYRRLARYRVGCEGRIAHLKRDFGARRSRLRGTAGAQIWVGWTTFTYNLDTASRLI
jgi:IS5 family transposase